jgi:hypothetical protein
MIALTVAGCAKPPAEVQPVRPQPATAPVESPRTAVTFARAALLKPQIAGENIYERLAPLIVQETSKPDDRAAAPGRLDRDANGLRVAADTSVIYYSTALRPVGGKQREQVTYTWFYPSDARQLRWRWLRLTLGDDGFPAVAETLSDDAGLFRIYASRSLEAAAIKGRELRDRFGAFALNRPDAAARAHLVSLYDDGPMPLGLFVYLDAAEMHFATVLCRCMPSQVREITETATFALVPADDWCSLGACPQDEMLGLPDGVELPDWAKAAAGPDWLPRVLRLPEQF